MDSISAVSITDRELAAHLESATAKILRFSWRAPTPEKRPAGESARLGGRTIAYRPLRSATGSAEEKQAESDFSLVDRVRAIVPRDELFTDVEHHVLRVIRRGIQVHHQIHDYYDRASGLDRLKAANRDGELASSDEAELRGKVEAGAAAALFAFHAYVVARLQGYQQDQTEAQGFEVEPPTEIALDGRTRSLHGALHHLYESIDRHARDDGSLVKAVHDAARAAALRLATIQHSLNHLEHYARYHYRIEPEGVSLSGFELPERGATTRIDVPEKRPEEVVGNHVAKLEATRIAQRLCCYDLERRTNPFVDLGGFVFTFIGDGSPGTGKTTLIQMIVSLLRDWTPVAALPFRYQNFSVDEISDYQGRSGQNAKRFCQTILDPGSVGFGTIDDVDQVCGNRNDRNASAGQLEVTAVFMQEFAGANTVIRGNSTFGLFSNYPEKVDDALRQRTQARFLVDGPRTHDDFADLFHILLSRHWELPLGERYEPLSTQDLKRVIDKKYAEHDVPRSAPLRRIYDAVLARSGSDQKLSTWREFGDYLHELQQYDERFTGRAVKNISDAVKARMMDFDLPAEWLEKRDAFFGRPYPTRVAMIEELRGEVTPEMVLQEIHRYAESEARYANAAEERELEDRTQQILLESRARQAAIDRDGSG